ncbi:kinase-like protein [Xylaria sp. CBS 124048]|nr:kinase-like protein [Xylaria sp. CBS 124048]
MWQYRNVPIMDEVEALRDYRPGGFAPLSIGDILNGRFEINQKLGYGGNAIVWLCWELATKKWKAVKINAAGSSLPDCGEKKAMRLMKRKKISVQELEANHIGMGLETFWEKTPNGRHFCTVLPVFGPPAHDWRTEELKLDVERVKNICYQMTKGLSFLHSHGLCHGDFRPQNVLMKLKPGCLDHLTKDAMFKLLGQPDVAEMLTLSGKPSKHAPRFVVTTAPWQRLREYVMDEAVIVDFGEAYTTDDPSTHFGIPKRYAAPEVLFERGQAVPAGDLWSLGITLLELRLDEYEPNAAYSVIRRMERFVGSLPIGYRYAAKGLLKKDGWVERSDDADDIVDSHGHLRPLTGPVEVPLSDEEEREFSGATFTDRLEMKLAAEQLAWIEVLDPRDPARKRMRPTLVPYYLTEEEVRDFADLLRNLLRYDAKDRISASRVLRHKWFKNQHPIGFFRRWRYVCIAGLSLVVLLCLYWLWNNWPSYSGLRPTRWVDTCVVTVLYLALD